MADKLKAASSSMIDLKAELFRKQEEYKQLRAQNASDFVKGRKSQKYGKGDIWSKKNAGVLERAGKDLAQTEEEENIMEKSRKALEAKSKIYDKIASESGIPEEDGSEGFLVDFQKKALDRIVERRREVTKNANNSQDCEVAPTSDDDDDINIEPVPPPSHPGEEWVDYVDSFGRSRRCMKKDLPDLQKQERPLDRPPSDGGLKLKEGATLLSADMKRELRRQQWEKEAEEAGNGPVHYSNVQFDEIRSHGTAFYQFSKDSNLREEQMDELNKLREQTMDNRTRSERIKEKRKAAMEARLAKVKQRRKMKASSMIELEEGEQEETAAETRDEKKEPEPLTRDDSWRQTAPVREWDKGKEKLPEWNAKHYMEKKRSERENDFAPPQFYYDQQPSGKTTLSASGGAHITQGAPQRPGQGPASKASPFVSPGTDAMLKQIRNNVEVLRPASGHAVAGVRTSETGSSHADAGLNVAAIPLPSNSVQTMGSQAKQDEEQRLLQETVPSLNITRGTSGSRDHIHINEQNSSFVQDQTHFAEPGHGQSYATVSQPHTSRLVLDVSVPPPGWSQSLPCVLPQLTATEFGPPQHATHVVADISAHSAEFSSSSVSMYPSQQGLLSALPQQSQSHPSFSVPPSANRTAGSNVPVLAFVDKRFMQNKEASDKDSLGNVAENPRVDPLAKVPAMPDDGVSTSSGFMYPSQQGLLAAMPQQSWSHNISMPSAADKTADCKTAAPRMTMVDKRFMQNREVSDEDLLGYMAEGSTDPLVKVQAVSYKPGIFSLGMASPTNAREGGTEPEIEAGREELSVGNEKKGDIPVAQTSGVIFGVPDFLQPASNVKAMTYQPGSFMAAKEAAAQRAEEGYEAARKKKQYSSAPVIYGSPDDSDAVDNLDNSEKIQDSAADTDSYDDEYAMFMKEVKGGK